MRNSICYFPQRIGSLCGKESQYSASMRNSALDLRFLRSIGTNFPLHAELCSIGISAELRKMWKSNREFLASNIFHFLNLFHYIFRMMRKCCPNTPQEISASKLAENEGFCGNLRYGHYFFPIFCSHFFRVLCPVVSYFYVVFPSSMLNDRPVCCHDNVVSANIPAKECQTLINSLPDDYSKTGQLMKSLTVVVGMIVVHTANVDVEDGLTNGATGVVKQIDFRMEGTNRPSIIWVLFDDPRVGRTTREKYRKLYNSSINTDWTPVFDVQRTFILNYKTYQRIQFPLTPASGKSVWKAEGATVDRVVVDLSQEKRIVKIPHIHYVALSRVKRLKDLYILNLNEASMALDDDVNVEMHRLRTEAALELCYVPLYKTDPGKIKIAFNNARSLHKHFRDVEFEPNVLAADAIGFAETRLCRRDENVHYALKRFRLIRLDDAEKESGNRPHHGLALYVKEYFQIQKVVKMQCKSFEFIFAGIYSIQRGYVQVVVLYKYPKSSQTDFRKDIHHHLRPVIDLNVRLVILGDFNIQIDFVNTEFVKFMETSFRCRQQIKQSTTDSGSILDLIFSNCEAFCDVVEAYWTDHKLVYCAIDQ